jgi:hypothetical protein
MDSEMTWPGSAVRGAVIRLGPTITRAGDIIGVDRQSTGGGSKGSLITL